MSIQYTPQKSPPLLGRKPAVRCELQKGSCPANPGKANKGSGSQEIASRKGSSQLDFPTRPDLEAMHVATLPSLGDPALSASIATAATSVFDCVPTNMFQCRLASTLPMRPEGRDSQQMLSKCSC